jgi:hypothetical protein
MPIDEARYDKLVKRFKELEAEVNRSEGVVEQMKKELRKEFKVKTIKEAKKLLAKLEREQEEAEEEFNSKLKEFEEKYEKEPDSKPEKIRLAKGVGKKFKELGIKYPAKMRKYND